MATEASYRALISRFACAIDGARGGAGASQASLARESAVSLPRIPTCAGHQRMSTVPGCVKEQRFLVVQESESSWKSFISFELLGVGALDLSQRAASWLSRQTVPWYMT